jgi:hypothetical protein
MLVLDKIKTLSPCGQISLRSHSRSKVTVVGFVLEFVVLVSAYISPSSSSHCHPRLVLASLSSARPLFTKKHQVILAISRECCARPSLPSFITVFISLRPWLSTVLLKVTISPSPSSSRPIHLALACPASPFLHRHYTFPLSLYSVRRSSSILAQTRPNSIYLVSTHPGSRSLAPAHPNSLYLGRSCIISARTHFILAGLPFPS